MLSEAIIVGHVCSNLFRDYPDIVCKQILDLLTKYYSSYPCVINHMRIACLTTTAIYSKESEHQSIMNIFGCKLCTTILFK